MCVFAASRLAGGSVTPLGGAATILPPVLVQLALLWAWRRTECCFDRSAGLLTVVQQGPLIRKSRREIPIASVSALVDRRSGAARAVELVLADRSTLVVARTRGAAISTLDAVARGLSELLDRPVQLGPGALIADRFEVERLMQAGGMGVVYRARDRETQRPVALKLILGPAFEEGRAARFVREIELLASLDHPRVARHVAHGETPDGHSFLAMEWLDGEDLGAALARGPLSLADSLRVIEGAAEAVAATHARGIVHRDLKPSNLFLRGRNPADLVLLDFGVARRLAEATRLTGGSALVGTPHYMAPEQASSARELTPAADVFALGCVFYECLTGRHPFDSGQLIGVLARILFDVPTPVTALRPNVPEAWSNLIERMLAKQPGRRPGDGAALLEELRGLSPPDASQPDAFAPTLTAAPQTDSADQVLLSVVLVNLPARAGPTDGEGPRLESMRAAMDRFGCAVEQLVNGSLLVAVLPGHGATDLARIAARCALYLREQMPGAKIAIATGRASGSSGHSNPRRVGDAVDRAVRLLEAADPGIAESIRLDTVTAALLEGRFVTAVREGTSFLVEERADADSDRLLLGKPTACVGRDVELLQLEGLASSALADSVAKAAVVVGPPGIGKSRLRRELLRRLPERLPEMTTLIGHGDPLSAGSPYVLLADALRRHAGVRVGDEPTGARAAIRESCARVDPSQAKRVEEFLGELCGVPFPDEGSPPLIAARGDHRVMSEQIALAFSDWLAAECRARPVAVVLEDAQWGDALTASVLERTLRELQRAPLFVVAFCRPEVNDVFPNLLGAQRALSLSLGPLSDNASAQLVKGVLGRDLDSAAIDTIVRLAAGNALFLEELIRAAAEGKAGDVPETVLAILQARLSRLSSEERTALRAAAIVGESFWPGAVRRVVTRWDLTGDVEASVAKLVREELVEPHRTSQFLAESEYGFRHALVRDAALGLLAEGDRRTGHLAAGEWLEDAGEPDAVVLARHAEEGGEPLRAVRFYAEAAVHSLAQHDFGEALSRAARGIASGARGEALGVLRGIEASSYYSQGQFTEAARAGTTALELSPKGGTVWCSTVETLLQVLPNVGAMQRSDELSRELFTVQPHPQATTAHLRALSTQILPYSLGGAREKGRACLDYIDRLGASVTETNVVARGYTRLWRAVFTCVLGDDLATALTLVGQAVRDLTESQVLYRVSLAHSLEALALRGVGDLAGGERAARRARAVAEAIRDDYHAGLGAWYLGLVLAEHDDAAKLEEAERCAEPFMRLDGNPLVQAVSRVVTARVALQRGEWGRAVADGEQARAGLLVMPPFRFLATPSVVYARLASGQVSEAAAVAREGMALLERVGSPVISEVPLVVAAAEAFHAAGDVSGARRTLRAALAQIERRAAHLSDPAMRESFLTGRRENRRASELARAWLHGGPG